MWQIIRSCHSPTGGQPDHSRQICPQPRLEHGTTPNIELNILGVVNWCGLWLKFLHQLTYQPSHRFKHKKTPWQKHSESSCIRQSLLFGTSSKVPRAAALNFCSLIHLNLYIKTSFLSLFPIAIHKTGIIKTLTSTLISISFNFKKHNLYHTKWIISIIHRT